MYLFADPGGGGGGGGRDTRPRFDPILDTIQYRTAITRPRQIAIHAHTGRDGVGIRNSRGCVLERRYACTSSYPRVTWSCLGVINEGQPGREGGIVVPLAVARIRRSRKYVGSLANSIGETMATLFERQETPRVAGITRNGEEVGKRRFVLLRMGNR